MCQISILNSIHFKKENTFWHIFWEIEANMKNFNEIKPPLTRQWLLKTHQCVPPPITGIPYIVAIYSGNKIRDEVVVVSAEKWLLLWQQCTKMPFDNIASCDLKGW